MKIFAQPQTEAEHLELYGVDAKLDRETGWYEVPTSSKIPLQRFACGECTRKAALLDAINVRSRDDERVKALSGAAQELNSAAAALNPDYGLGLLKNAPEPTPTQKVHVVIEIRLPGDQP